MAGSNYNYPNGTNSGYCPPGGFSQPVDPTIAGVLGLLGISAIPFAAYTQPQNTQDVNTNPLLQFTLPGGATLQPYMDGALTQSNFGTAINNLLGIFAPFVAAYSLILPILGVIRGIIEVLCAIANPFSLIRAIIRLFTKWIPPILALFPPLAGVLLLLGILKIIIAVLLFILLVVIPIIALIIENIKAMGNISNKNAQVANQKHCAISDKLRALLLELANQLGVLALVSPILGIIQAILGLASGKPCDDGGGNSNAQFPGAPFFLGPPLFNSDNDSSCCGPDVCPEILLAPPSGQGTFEVVLINNAFNSSQSSFAFKLITNDSNISQLLPYFVNVNGQSGGAINRPVPPPNTEQSDGSTLKVKITNKRGVSETLSILSFVDNNENLILSSSIGNSFLGNVTWEVVPDYNILIFNNIISLGCSPDVASTKNSINSRFPDLEIPISSKFPQLANIADQYQNFLSDFGSCTAQLTALVEEAIEMPYPFDPTSIIDQINALQNECIIPKVNAFLGTTRGYITDVISGSADSLNTGNNFKVDPAVVKADGYASSTISLIVVDPTGNKISANLPNDIDLPVVFNTNFGIISDQSFNSTTGEITAKITSDAVGIAEITAQVNGVYVTDFDTNTNTQSESIRIVTFVADQELPARRFIGQETGTKVSNTPQNGPKQGNG